MFAFLKCIMKFDKWILWIVTKNKKETKEEREEKKVENIFPEKFEFEFIPLENFTFILNLAY